ncbi:ATP-binding protein [Nocardioides mangrovi]|uniref:LuxR C-terminal-related transcriptional regulator n=1 Tax=Nocardioides mangrovi TaxID=2874580 RepID=A0ABS7UHT0_9ACTN|nr:LuxR C-terminal-related transcriptional regulator [Nocardioides mangrovi]MBZ5740360.1 LuxR C-terminal-related transcriptional regulator [Nocardioides mangrovi]
MTLIGPGGIGKTRVAIRVVELFRQARAYPDGTWVVALEDLTTGGLLVSAVGDAVGLQIPDAPHAVTTLTDFVADRRALLLLDNCEHLYREVGDLVQRMRAACPHLSVLVTSRRPLLISGEDVVTVASMTTPGRRSRDVDDPEALGHYEAVQLFVRRARAAYSPFTLTEANAGAVARLCTELDGNPLALELAASRIRVFTPQEILERLTDRFGVLNAGFQDVPDRHRSLLACVEWSHSLCSPAEQLLWAQVWVFKGGFSLLDAESVCTAIGPAPDEEGPLVDLIGSLVDQSVLVAEADASGGSRYRMLADIREYGRGVARSSGTEAGLRERHVRWCGDLAARFRATWAGPDQALWLARIETERANIRAALHHGSTTSGLVEAALLIAADLDMFWSGSGRLGEALTWFGVLLDTGEGSDLARARAAVGAARFAVLVGDGPAARDRLSLAAGLAVDDPATRGRGLIPAAVLAVWDGDATTARTNADRAVAALDGTDDLSGLMLAYLMSGVVRYATGDPRAAAASFEACISVAAICGDGFLRAFALNGLGDVASTRRERKRAAELYRQALRIKHGLGDRMGMAVALDSLGRLAASEGRGRRAALLLGAAEGIWDTVGMTQTGNILTHTRAREPGIEPARALLGKRDFRDQFRRGSLITLDQAVDFALDPDRDDLPAEAAPGEAETHPLTKRELEVADLVAEGLSNPQIADRLVISVRTAQGHVENILRKLGFSSRSLIAAWVAERRQVDPRT